MHKVMLIVVVCALTGCMSGPPDQHVFSDIDNWRESRLVLNDLEGLRATQDAAILSDHFRGFAPLVTECAQPTHVRLPDGRFFGCEPPAPQVP